MPSNHQNISFNHSLPDLENLYNNLDRSGFRVIDLVLSVGKAIDSSDHYILKNMPLYSVDADILLYLKASGHPYKLNPTRLMQAVKITSGAMTAALKRLEKLELIRRLADPADGRGSLAELDSKGLNIIDDIVQLRLTDVNSWFEVFDELEKRHFVKLLSKLQEQIHNV